MKNKINAIKDLIEIAKIKNCNMPAILENAYYRGLVDGKELAKKKAIEAIEQEK